MRWHSLESLSLERWYYSSHKGCGPASYSAYVPDSREHSIWIPKRSGIGHPFSLKGDSRPDVLTDQKFLEAETHSQTLNERNIQLP